MAVLLCFLATLLGSELVQARMLQSCDSYTDCFNCSASLCSWGSSPLSCSSGASSPSRWTEIGCIDSLKFCKSNFSQIVVDQKASSPAFNTEKKKDTIYEFSMRLPDRAFYANQKNLPLNYFCSYEMKFTAATQEQKLIKVKDGDKPNPLTYKLIVERTSLDAASRQEEIEILLEYEDLANEILADQDLYSTSLQVIEGEKYLSEVQIEIEEAKVVKLRRLLISAKNAAYTTEKSSFVIYVKEDYARDEDLGGGLSEGAILTLLTVGFVILCLASIGYFIKYKRQQISEGEELTETEERFLSILKVRKAIRKAERNAVDPDQDPHLVDRLKDELRDLKARLLEEFLDVLDIVQLSDDDHGTFDIEDCMVCMDKMLSSQRLYQMPVCKHMFHEHCVRDWFDSKNQEREQRCPLCNVVLDITALRKAKHARDLDTQGDVGRGHNGSPFLPQPSQYATSSQNQVTPLSLDNTAMKANDNATIIIPERQQSIPSTSILNETEKLLSHHAHNDSGFRQRRGLSEAQATDYALGQSIAMDANFQVQKREDQELEEIIKEIEMKEN